MLSKQVALVLSIAAGLAACGGGAGGNLNGVTGSGSTPSSNTPLVGISIDTGGLVGTGSSTFSSITAEGIWQGSTSTSRTLLGLIVDNGDYWLMYSAAGNPNLLAGIILGNSFSANNILTTNSGRDISFETARYMPVSWRGSYIPQGRLQGTFTYPDLPASNVSFTAIYNTTYSNEANLAAVVGTYTGSSVHLERGVQSAALTVQANGQISGRRGDGCTFSGGLTPRSRGNAYSLVLYFNGSNCPDRNAYSRGTAFFSADNRQLYSAGLLYSTTLANTVRDGEDAFVFLGRR